MKQTSSNFAIHALAYMAIAAVVAGLGLAFAWAGGWIGPKRVSGADVADALEYNAGPHPGYRRAHAKGLCFTGQFEANGEGARLSQAPQLQAGFYPVAGRFSIAGGNPLAPDGRNVFHSMALTLYAQGGQQWRMALDHAEVFPVADVASFVDLQRATRPLPNTGRPDPQAMQAFLADHPETRAFQAYMAANPLPDAFTNGAYHSINAFRFTNAQGQERMVRWSMQPEDPLAELDKTSLGLLPDNVVFDNTRERIMQAPARWRMVVTVADPQDITDDATIAWPADREAVDVGTLTVTAVVPEEGGSCRDLVFDPTILPVGVAPSDDPLLAARSAAYASSFRRRAAEGPRPAILQPSAPSGME